jgi:hypothetical protein
MQPIRQQSLSLKTNVLADFVGHRTGFVKFTSVQGIFFVKHHDGDGKKER